MKIVAEPEEELDPPPSPPQGSLTQSPGHPCPSLLALSLWFPQDSFCHVCLSLPLRNPLFALSWWHPGVWGVEFQNNSLPGKLLPNCVSGGEVTPLHGRCPETLLTPLHLPWATPGAS